MKKLLSQAPVARVKGCQSGTGKQLKKRKNALLWTIKPEETKLYSPSLLL
jgi:hypothetical protein